MGNIKVPIINAKGFTCPHCGVSFHDGPSDNHMGNDHNGQWHCRHRRCPTCSNTILSIVNKKNINGKFQDASPERLVYPVHSGDMVYTLYRRHSLHF